MPQSGGEAEAGLARDQRLLGVPRLLLPRGTHLQHRHRFTSALGSRPIAGFVARRRRPLTAHAVKRPPARTGRSRARLRPGARLACLLTVSLQDVTSTPLAISGPDIALGRKRPRSRDRSEAMQKTHGQVHPSCTSFLLCAHVSSPRGDEGAADWALSARSVYLAHSMRACPPSSSRIPHPGTFASLTPPFAFGRRIPSG